ncbi:MAG: proliferating cell nuclear antigen (pcna) [Candidatus Aenigmarchaeota archaeon]|nr:proliferating cell nuclear antigen (pcna) [Candidatus Aenigmarchaeota archaeon]
MFNATLSNVSVFKDALSAISELVSEGTFMAKKDGLFFTATDPTMVTLVDFKFMAGAFEDYKTEADAEISISLENLLNVLRRAKATDKVSLELDNNTNKLKIALSGGSERKFTIPLLDIEKGEVPEMKLDFPATVEISTSILSDGIADASIVTDTIVLGVNTNEFTMSAEGDLSDAQLKLKGGAEGVVGIATKGEEKSKYSLEYLKKIEKGGKIANTVKIQFGTDYPLKVTFTEKDVAEISYVLAPRVDD